MTRFSGATAISSKQYYGNGDEDEEPTKQGIDSKC